MEPSEKRLWDTTFTAAIRIAKQLNQTQYRLMMELAIEYALQWSLIEHELMNVRGEIKLSSENKSKSGMQHFRSVRRAFDP